jgi:hypothetical protein
MTEYKQMINQKEDLILRLTDEERNRLLEREKYLLSQRDEFIQDLKSRIQ